MRSSRAIATSFLLLGRHASTTTAAAVSSISALTAQWNLNAADFGFAMPSETMDSGDAQSWVAQNWDLNGNINWGGNDIVFSPDPSTSTSTLVRRQATSDTYTRSSRSHSHIPHSSTADSSNSSQPTSTLPATAPASTNLAGEPPVLRIGYPQGSYSKRTGGTQFYAAPLNATGQSNAVGNSSSDGQYERMLLSYDIWFPTGFAWNMGGKLPGLRGGPDSRGCSGGNETDGTSCFSTRLMWRSGGAGEVYAYIPTSQKNFCSQSQITCNSDFGTSLARGSFTFATGQWQTIYLLVVLNAEGVANGVVELYYNGVLAMSFTDLAIRTASSISSIGGMFFSTFFGGDDSTWATPTNQYTYYRNLHLYAGYGASNATGSAIASSAMSSHAYSSWMMLSGVVLVAVLGFGGSAI